MPANHRVILPRFVPFVKCFSQILQRFFYTYHKRPTDRSVSLLFDCVLTNISQQTCK